MQSDSSSNQVSSPGGVTNNGVPREGNEGGGERINTRGESIRREFGDFKVGTGAGSRRRSSSRSSRGEPVLPSVTGSPLKSPLKKPLPPSERSKTEGEIRKYRNSEEEEDIDHLDSVSLQGANIILQQRHPHYHPSHTGQCHPQSGGSVGDTQSVVTFDAQSVITDNTQEEKSIVPLHVTFTRAQSTAAESNASRRPFSPKSVRFSVPDEGTERGGGGGWVLSSAHSDISQTGSGGGSVVDGFFLQPGYHAVSWLNNFAKQIPLPKTNVINLVTNSQQVKKGTPIVMKNRGALSNSKQVPGRYFPPLALSQEPGFTTVTPFSSRRIGSGVSTFSAPPSLERPPSEYKKKERISNFAITSSLSWKSGQRERSRTFSGIQEGHSSVKRSGAVHTSQWGQNGGPWEGGRVHGFLNQDTQRNTSYNKKKQSFWEMYDADPYKFTISFKDETPYSPEPSSTESAHFVLNNYYMVKRTSDYPKICKTGLKTTTKKKDPAFKGCLEGTTKTLHRKKSESRGGGVERGSLGQGGSGGVRV